MYFWRLVRDTELTTITINILLSEIQNYKHFTHREIHRNDHLTFCQIPTGDPQTSRITLGAHIPFVFYFISACNPWNRTTINFTNQQMVIYNSNNCFSCIPIQITNICLNSIRLIPVESIHRHTALKWRGRISHVGWATLCIDDNKGDKEKHFANNCPPLFLSKVTITRQ